MKYKVGDKVRIVSEIVTDNWSSAMDEYLGKIMTISKVKPNYYDMEEDGGYWCWDDCMIAGLADEPQGDAEPEQSLEELKKENTDLIRQNYDKATLIDELQRKNKLLSTESRDDEIRRLKKKTLELETQNKEFLEIIKNFSKAGGKA